MNVAVPVVAGVPRRAGAAEPAPSRRTEAITSVRRIELTPARTRTRLAKGVMCSIFSLRNPDLIVCVTMLGANSFHQASVALSTDILPPRYRNPQQIGRGGMGDI